MSMTSLFTPQPTASDLLEESLGLFTTAQDKLTKTIDLAEQEAETERTALSKIEVAYQLEVTASNAKQNVLSSVINKATKVNKNIESLLGE